MLRTCTVYVYERYSSCFIVVLIRRMTNLCGLWYTGLLNNNQKSKNFFCVELDKNCFDGLEKCNHF